MKAIRIEQYGDPEVLQVQEIPVPEPKADEVRLRLEAAGVNFIDVYHRTGLYPVALPFTPGSEAAGIVEAVGTEVAHFKTGDRVGYAMSLGAYAEAAVVPAWKCIPLPASLGALHAAAVLLQGMTVHYLAHGSYVIRPGDTVLVHAAAGGVGLMLVQIARHLGAFVIGTVSTVEKAAIAKDAGAHEAILYTETDFHKEVKRITEGRGVHVVYDSVGQATFEHSLDCLRPRGTLVLFGQSSGPVASFNPAILAAKGSLFLTRPSLAHYAATREELLERASTVFDWISSGILKIRIDKTFPLNEAAEAHLRLESRISTGKILLLP